ncbi:Eco57I restriction-modification methylase domain-containing protein [Segatella buccae]|uniref:Eco57I restriction-modification methylase domain-containing protein n=1 Tax=Segatella buccae TaxID=28126 RepID=UPI003A522CB9
MPITISRPLHFFNNLGCRAKDGFDIVIGNPPYMCAVSKKTSCTSTPNYPLSPQMLQS